MSGDLERQIREDRAMRDQALALVKADIAHLKSDYAQKGIKERATDKIKGGADGIYSEAVEVASDHRGIIAAFVAALVLWFARHPILDLFSSNRSRDDSDDDEAEGRSIFDYGR